MDWLVAFVSLYRSGCICFSCSSDMSFYNCSFSEHTDLVRLLPGLPLLHLRPFKLQLQQPKQVGMFTGKAIC